ncbi:Peroxiredoxin-6 [Cryptotermes secundus]|uniref:1-Cys peroxiredoxin n=2 Tax=Cryptotermes secundus TaxID=105785 RepID=A0A2J7RF32_9NEOP|nr:peroxiredoxin-6 isoform X2 [Cryptotermes secundus]XP_023701879.1 peroxiredoxin-6 isoform X2 [Cryptotermes secundus]XP_023701880.1 peroxiredoxin-6 isoform X2 [Cryptotermes secundus]XP_023701881.1 peroxiredoxin-6 isoform X2 [Cryptotermes secundus]XP_023701882.1 peroxiredoxin-6 isoform X2 [Cryptotermes secundus]XP_023701883.1 peroxiredoxin-6 isoform X2 [Cryptotermes secundus]PNF39427.1 Peroxiredoxin-6 [Cryptotermes secundus]
MRLGSLVPNFWAETTMGPIKFHEWLGQSWCVLFSHPADFTPVCTTELGRIAQEANEFFRRGVKLLGHSCDSLQQHKKWLDDIRSYFRNIPLEFPYPIISDESRELAVRLDMLDDENRWDPVVASTIRALYIIGPDFKVKLSMFYPNSTGRNVHEILRVIDSLQLTERLRVVTPADWTMGKEVMVVPEVEEEDLPKLFPRGVEKVRMPSGIAYVRTTRDYGHASECWDGAII